MIYRYSAVLFALSLVLISTGADWRQFRGNYGASAAAGAAPPSSWSDDENVAWKVDLVGRGPSSPIVVQGRVYVTCSDGARQDRLLVLCFDAATGQRLWRREFWATGRTMTHPTSAVAAPTPASDGERIFAFFSSNDLICLDLDGNLLWYRGLAYDFPKAGNDVGMSSSPTVVGDTVVVQIENQGDSFAAGLDAASGETKWRVDRTKAANWASPMALPRSVDGRSAVLLSDSKSLQALDAADGRELWSYELKCSSIPSVVATPQRIIVPGGGLTVLELPEGATAPALLWQSNRLNASQASPIVGDRFVLTMNGAGVLTCADLQDGKILWQLRVGGTHWATPVLAGDLLYCFNQDGEARVVKISDAKGEVIHSVQLGEKIQGSPAIVDGALYVRSDKHLWKVAQRR
ncbi:MAG: PQQ-binding-like beta-propeller repeat protein [Pirellulaceae bacterium]